MPPVPMLVRMARKLEVQRDGIEVGVVVPLVVERAENAAPVIDHRHRVRGCPNMRKRASGYRSFNSLR